MKRIFLIFQLLSVFASQIVSASPIDRSAAEQIATDFYYKKSSSILTTKATETAAPGLELVYDTAEPGAANAFPIYVFSPASGTGFVMVAANAIENPVVGYSLTTSFDSDNLPVQLREIISYYTAEESPAIGVEPGVAVEPLLSTAWDQGLPYNLLLNDGDSYYPAGCTATATAQVMKCFNWPLTGNGDVNAANKFMRLDISSSFYDWGNMLDTYKTGKYTSVEAEAVALLMQDVGFALESVYGTETLASVAAPAFALVRNFGYSPDLRFMFRSSFSDQAWIDAVRESLLNGSPVIYTAQSPQTNGHAFVCDGITADNYLHINWGWGGTADGYYNMNVMAPSNTPSTSPAGPYKRLQTAIFNIKPCDDPHFQPDRFIAPLSLASFTADKSVLDSDGRLSGDNIDLLLLPYNSSGSNLGSEIPLTIVPVVTNADGSLYRIISTSSRTIDSFHKGALYSDDLRLSVPRDELADLPDGQYFIGARYVLSTSLDELTPDDLLNFNGGDLTADKSLTKMGAEIYLSTLTTIEEAMDAVELAAISTPGSLYLDAQPNILNITLRNNSDRILCGITPGDNALGSIYLVPEGATQTAIPSAVPAAFLCYIYAHTEVDIAVNLYNIAEMCPKTGLYDAYVVLSAGPGRQMHVLNADNPFKVAVDKMAADVEVLFSKAFTLSDNVIDRRCNGNDIELTIYPIVDTPYNGYFQVRAIPADADTDGDELIIYDEKEAGLDPVTIMPYHSRYTSPQPLHTDAFIKALPGQYVAKVYYLNGEGEMVPVMGSNNRFVFTLNDMSPDCKCGLELAAPVEINDGEPVELGHVEFDIVAEITSHHAVDLSVSTLEPVFLDSVGNPADTQPAFLNGEPDYSSPVIAGGETVEIIFHMVSNEPGEGIHAGDRFQVMFRSGNEYIQSEEHQESLIFVVTESSAITDVTDSRCDISATLLNGAIVIEGLSGDSKATLHDLAGHTLATKRFSGPSGIIPAVSLRPGVYMVVVESGLSARTFKILIR